ncbi:PEGA domain-containing protein [Ereboglobus luteus]|uniref:PEGA domain-containing protein n=1 Tax=Ereboglobus luteus TaxID=1796921 RepID=A0A2U8E0L1_9BACT|nr:PEGA domain-containing protein [Ereboglobus luteus]AWI08397.1 hypothetical protein CKA38_03240 [Ereboglobus luteus]
MKNPTVRILGTSALIVLALVASGCASILNSGSRDISIRSQPEGANVTIAKADTGVVVMKGTTPMSVFLSPKRGYFKGQSYNLKIELPGYTTAEVVVSPKISGWYFGNIIFGGVIGMLVVDPVTGAMWNLSPSQIDREINPAQAQLIKQGDGFLVVMLEDASAAERERMLEVN